MSVDAVAANKAFHEKFEAAKARGVAALRAAAADDALAAHGGEDITSLHAGYASSGASVVMASKAGVVNVTIGEGGTADGTTLLTEKRIAARKGFVGEVIATVLPNGGVLVSRDYLLLRAVKGGGWDDVGGDDGLHTAIMQSDA